MNLRARAGTVFMGLPINLRVPLLHRLGRYAPWEPGFDFTPPVLRPDKTAGPPDFVGIGVQKAGTTWWFGQIAGHPEVYTRDDLHKERHFFDRFGTEPFRKTDIEAYHGWFPRPAGCCTGEWTPDYASSPWVAPLLAQAAPDARLLVLLRDPVERFRSGLAHQRRMGESNGPLSIADALQRGFYHRALTGWMAHFAPSQILVQQFEQCVQDPAAQLRATFEFLGLPDGPVPPPPAAVVASSGTRNDPDPELRDRLVAIYEPDVRALATLAPGLDLSLWPNFAHLSAGESPGGGANSPTRRT